MTIAQDWAQVAVPQDLLPEVYRLVLEHLDATPTAGSHWDEFEIIRLKYHVTNPGVRALMDLVSATPEQFVSMNEIEKASGRSSATLRSDLGGLTKLLNREFPGYEWPFEYEPRHGGTRGAYRMRRDVAKWWSTNERLDET